MSRTITVKNITQNNQSFDDKTLIPQGQVTVPSYTDDILQGYALGHLLLDPVPSTLEILTTTINPCQLPLPVRLIGGFQGLFTPAQITDLDPITVGDTLPTKLLGRDDSRTNFRFRNIGANPVAVGGSQVTFLHGVRLMQPGDTLDEQFAPNVAWYAICGTGLTSTLVGLTVGT